MKESVRERAVMLVRSSSVPGRVFAAGVGGAGGGGREEPDEKSGETGAEEAGRHVDGLASHDVCLLPTRNRPS